MFQYQNHLYQSLPNLPFRNAKLQRSLFFSTSPPFTTGFRWCWVILNEVDVSGFFTVPHSFGHCMPLLFANSSWFVICSYCILFSCFSSFPPWSIRSQFVEFSVRHILCVAASTWDPFQPASLILTAPAFFCMLNDPLPFQLYMPTRLWQEDFKSNLSWKLYISSPGVILCRV